MSRQLEVPPLAYVNQSDSSVEVSEQEQCRQDEAARRAIVKYRVEYEAWVQRDQREREEAERLRPFALWVYEYLSAAVALLKAMLDAPAPGESSLSSPRDRSLRLIAAACRYELYLSRDYVKLFGIRQDLDADLWSRRIDHSSSESFFRDFMKITDQIDDDFLTWRDDCRLSSLLQRPWTACTDEVSFDKWLRQVGRQRPEVNEEVRRDIPQTLKDCELLLRRLEQFGFGFGWVGQFTSVSRHGLFSGMLHWIDVQCQDKLGRQTLEATLSTSMVDEDTMAYLELVVGVARFSMRRPAASEADTPIDEREASEAQSPRRTCLESGPSQQASEAREPRPDDSHPPRSDSKPRVSEDERPAPLTPAAAAESSQAEGLAIQTVEPHKAESLGSTPRKRTRRGDAKLLLDATLDSLMQSGEWGKTDGEIAVRATIARSSFYRLVKSEPIASTLARYQRESRGRGPSKASEL
jgi:hypothetical protein